MTRMTDRITQLTDWSKHAQEQVQSAIAKDQEDLAAAIEQVQRETEQRAEKLRREGAEQKAAAPGTGGAAAMRNAEQARSVAANACAVRPSTWPSARTSPTRARPSASRTK